MRFKYPGGGLAWLTLLWFVVGCLLAYHCYAADRYWLGGLFACLAISCALVWFDVRFIYKPLVAFWVLAIAAGLRMIVAKGFTFGRLWQIVLAGYTIRALYVWGTEHERAILEAAPLSALSEPEEPEPA